MESNKNLGLKYNVTFRIIDEITGKIISEHIGHNSVTSSLLTGIGHYLVGESVLNQGYDMLKSYVPIFISLGTMGLINQKEDDEGLPMGIGVWEQDDLGNPLSEEQRFKDYLSQAPGFGADNVGDNGRIYNNNRKRTGLGPPFAYRIDPNLPLPPSVSPDPILYVAPTINCELISDKFPRSWITYRDIVPEEETEVPQTIDVAFSAMISTGALATFREPGKDYIFITESGLWSRPDYVYDLNDDRNAFNGIPNGLLAGYRIGPVNSEEWDMGVEDNRYKLKKQILRVGINQVVQVIWKIQLGTVKDFLNVSDEPPIIINDKLYWNLWGNTPPEDDTDDRLYWNPWI